MPRWSGVLDAPLAVVEALIAGVTSPGLKAPRLRAVLDAVRERAGALSLDFLAGMGVEEARAWLQAM